MSAQQVKERKWDFNRHGPFMKQQYPIGPLIEFAAKKWKPVDEASDMLAGDVAKVSAVLDITQNRVYQLLDKGFISSVLADELAVTKLGVHPSAIWDNWFDEPSSGQAT